MQATFSCRTLPDPLLREDGTRLTSPAQWPEQAARLRDLAQACYYGTWPGRPQSVDATILSSEEYACGAVKAIREKARLRVNEAFDVDVTLTRPDTEGRVPVIVYNISPAWPDCPAEDAVISSGYAIAAFNREQLAPDDDIAKAAGYWEETRMRTYPQLPCGEIMAWAWGHTIVADWLTTCAFAGPLICTGHSRGGKAALCAGIFDDRFAVVAPIGSGNGGAGCCRFLGTAKGSRQDPEQCETIGRMARMFPQWMGPNYIRYGSDEAPYPVGEATYRLPFDAHTLRALCAPRAVFNSEGEDDGWCNSFGAQLCWQASQPVFDWLGVPNVNGFHMRPGGHAFNELDWLALLDFCGTVLHRPRLVRMERLNQPYYTIPIKDYAPWY